MDEEQKYTRLCSQVRTQRGSVKLTVAMQRSYDGLIFRHRWPSSLFVPVVAIFSVGRGGRP